MHPVAICASSSVVGYEIGSGYHADFIGDTVFQCMKAAFDMSFLCRNSMLYPERLAVCLEHCDMGPLKDM